MRASETLRKKEKTSWEFFFKKNEKNTTRVVEGQVTARRHGTHPHDASRRSDGVATYVRLTSKQPRDRSATPSAVACRETVRFADGRVALLVATEFGVVANVHLPFPSSGAAVDKQATQADAVAAAVDALAARLEVKFAVVCGDFNGLHTDGAAVALAARGWANCACAAAEMSLQSGVGGRTDLGATHLTHLGDLTSCDHVFARDYCYAGDSWAGGNKMGHFDAVNGELSDVCRIGDEDHLFFSDSDHLPVIATFAFDDPSTAAAAAAKAGVDQPPNDGDDDDEEPKAEALFRAADFRCDWPHSRLY